MAALLIIVVMVLLLLAVVVNLLMRQATGVYNGVRWGELSFGLDFQWVGEIQPARAINLVHLVGIPDTAALRKKLTAIIMQSGEFFAEQAINLGQTIVNLHRPLRDALPAVLPVARWS
jgi:hypothetical protein